MLCVIPTDFGPNRVRQEDRVISQENISADTPMGATLVSGGTTFRVWAPRATAVYLNGVFGGKTLNAQTDDLLLAKDDRGYWTGFLAGAAEGDLYRFYVAGAGSSGYKRDPYARGLAKDAPFPNGSCYIRSGTAYPWHDAGFVTPDFTDMIVYQIHIGTYAIRTPGVSSTFLDVIGKIPYLVELGINVLQPLPVDEVETDPSMGYDGADYFSPDFPYVVWDATALAGHLETINGLLEAKGLTPLLELKDIESGHAQLKSLIDLCHVYGIAVAFDVVYNHAGGFTVNGALDDACLYYFDRVVNAGNNNDSLYFTDQDRGTGGLAFALWNSDVRQFLLNNALYYVEEFHADGFRYDEISILLSTNRDSGWSFCNDLTSTLRFVKPKLLQNAEYWQGEFNDYPKSAPSIVTPVAEGGAGFDVLQHDGQHRAGALSGGVCAWLADGALRGEPRPGQSGPPAADPGAGRFFKREIVVCAQPVALCDGDPADGSGDSATVYGAGVPGRKAVGHASGLAQLTRVERAGARRRPGDGEPSAFYAGPDPAAMEPACVARRQRESVSCTRWQPRDCVSSLGGRRGAGCGGGGDAG